MDFFDYLKWRGDLSFEASPFNSVDSLILCQLSYLNFDGIVSDCWQEKQSLSQVYERFKQSDFEKRSDLGLLINPLTVKLMEQCACSTRFGSLNLCGYKNEYHLDSEEQFCAVTFVYSGGTPFVYSAFRGTDDTIIGWKEDFNLAFIEKLPAQQEALEYLEECAAFFKEMPLMCGGHSKGGNLAVYAGAMLSAQKQKQLERVYNFDGPGFLKETLETPPFKAVLSKTKSYFPQGAIVGMLFEHGEQYSVVKSDGVLIMQHDPFTWQVEALDFELCSELEKSSQFFNTTFNQWYVRMTPEKRRIFVETLFGALEATKAETNSQLAENWLKNGPIILKAFMDMDKDIRHSAVDTALQFVKLAGHNFPELLKQQD